jgi:signal transduction histidine kinase
VRGELQTRKISLQTELAENIPRVLADRIQLEQVILNLVMNAAEAMASSGRPRLLHIRSAKHEGGGVYLAVQDSGPGISCKNMNRVFDAFFTTKSEGIGMGLSICRSILEAHGGQISVSRVDPHGSVFHVVLPNGKIEAGHERAICPRSRRLRH